MQRFFLDEIYSIIDGVAQGLGRAVVPIHLIENRKDVKVVSGYKPLFNSVYLSFLKRPYYSKLHHLWLEEFI